MNSAIAVNLRRVLPSFGTKLIAGAGVLVLTIGALAVSLYISTERYQYHLERSVSANKVLSSFQAVSDHTYRKLNAVGQIVATSFVGDVDERLANEKILWAALTQTQHNLEAENALDEQPDFAEKLERLAQIEAIVERIIQGGATIRQAVESGEPQAAQDELARLQSQEIAGRFNNLIDEAIAIERVIVESTQADAISLGEFIARFLPTAIVITLVLGTLVAVVISRSLRMSLAQLQDAAEAFTSGNLEHRLVDLPDQEFSRLAEAFNRMAAELSARRTEARQSQASLERQVAERTQELSHTLGQLRNADATRRRFLADISHELRTPLTLIQGEAEMVMRGSGKTAEEYCEALTRVRDQAVHTNRLVKDLLLMARAEEGNLLMEHKSVELLELIKEVCADFRSALSKKQLRMIQELPEQCVFTKGDPSRLRQVFAILIDNAIRYSDVQQVLSIQLTRRGDHATFEVRDRGAVLSEHDLPKVFDRFYRGGEAADKTEGSGLGLPVARAIVEAHEGSIELQREPDGITAIVRLRVHD